MPVAKELRRKLKQLAETTATEICRATKTERPEARGYFVNVMDHSVEAREAEEREIALDIQRMIDDGCPNVQNGIAEP